MPAPSAPEGVEADAEIAKWAQALEKGIIEPRSYLMKVFLKEHAKGTEAGKQFAEHTSYAAKREFRRQWLEVKKNNAVESASHRHTVTKTDGEMGNYLAVGPLVIAEGGWSDPAAVRAAKCLVVKALQRGGDWLWHDPQTERLEFLTI